MIKGFTDSIKLTGDVSLINMINCGLQLTDDNRDRCRNANDPFLYTFTDIKN